MTEETFLRTVINEVLPNLPEVSKDILEETLQSIGVETYDDFQFIVEDDLLSALRPVQARKALAAWKLRCKFCLHDTISAKDYLSTFTNRYLHFLLNVWDTHLSCVLKAKALQPASPLQMILPKHLHLYSLYHLKVHHQSPPTAIRLWKLTGVLTL